MDEATFTVTRAGYSKLIHNGYLYTKKQIIRGGTSWRCVMFQRTLCKGKALTRKIRGNHMVKTYAPHNHPPDHQ